MDQILDLTVVELLQYFTNRQVPESFGVAFNRPFELAVIRKGQLVDLTGAVRWLACLSANGQLIAKVQTERDLRGIRRIHLLKGDLSGQEYDVEKDEYVADENKTFVEAKKFERESEVHFRNQTRLMTI